MSIPTWVKLSFVGIIALIIYDRAKNSVVTELGPRPCDLLLSQDYDVLGFFDIPVPDYSFAMEPEEKGRKIDEILKKLKENIDSLIDSEYFRNFLTTMSKFHNYSIGNLILIAFQKKDATQVAGFYTWKDLGRFVKKGEHGIAILAPCLPSKQKTIEQIKEERQKRGEPEPTEEEIEQALGRQEARYFKVVYVFDVSQTEGKELPKIEAPPLSGEANEPLFRKATLYASQLGVTVTSESKPELSPELKGFYDRVHKLIWVRPEESRAQQLKTFLHELGHYLTESRHGSTDAETIAESVAYTVGAHFGFDTGTRSFPYVALWSKDKKVLERNLGIIRKISGQMIDALEPVSGV